MQAQLCKTVVLDNATVAHDIKMLTVQYDARWQNPVAGQFYMLRCWGADEAPLLSRPISVHDYDDAAGTLTFLYQIKGIGTEKLAALKEGSVLTLTGPSGNGFMPEKLHGKIALVGGGIGTAPLLQLAHTLADQGETVDFYGGWRDEPYRTDAFAEVCRKVTIATDKGTVGVKGFVTDIVPYAEYDAVCVCGPEVVMQKAASYCRQANVPCYVSKEAKMACGVGACLGCTCKTKNGGKSVCKDGPVFAASEVYGDE